MYQFILSPKQEIILLFVCFFFGNYWVITLTIRVFIVLMFLFITRTSLLPQLFLESLKSPLSPLKVKSSP